MNRSLSIALVVLLVLAGCSGTDPGGTTTPDVETSERPTTVPTTPTTAAPATTERTETTKTSTQTTATGERTIAVEGGELPVDANLMFDRIENITGSDGQPPRHIHVTEPGDLEDVDDSRSTLDRYLGFSPAKFDVHGLATPTPEPGQVRLNASMTPNRTEAVLAHELYHVLWFQQDLVVFDNRRNMTSQKVFLSLAMAEGAAEYVQQEYWRRYMHPESFEPAAYTRRTYRDGTPMKRSTRAAYYFGYRYLDHRLDSPRNLTEAFDDPPRTTEELIHQLPPGSEPQTPLSVEGRSGDDWSLDPRVEPDARQLDRYVSPDTKGELFVRHALQVGVNDTAAARAAAGWGTDGMLAFQRESDQARGFVWTLRFDDAANASEFETVFNDYLSNRGSRDGPVWTTRNADGTAFRVVTVDERTVALAFGPRSFAANTSITVSNETVVAEVP